MSVFQVDLLDYGNDWLKLDRDAKLALIRKQVYEKHRDKYLQEQKDKRDQERQQNQKP